MPVSDVEIVMLGTGTSAGVPVIGCDCAVCTSDDPRDRRTRPAACVRFVDAQGRPRVILIDASPDLREQALRHKLQRCDAIIFTHNHVDHTFGLDEVRRFNVVMQAPIHIYAEGRTLEFLDRVYRHIFARHKNVNDSFVATLIPHAIEVDQPLDLHGLRFSPVRLLHVRHHQLRNAHAGPRGDEGEKFGAEPPAQIGVLRFQKPLRALRDRLRIRQRKVAMPVAFLVLGTAGLRHRRDHRTV